MTNRGLEFDKRVGLIVLVGWAGLASTTVVDIVANCTLVSGSTDIGREAFTSCAERSITADADVDGLGSRAVRLLHLEMLVNRHKTVLRVGGIRVGDAVAAVVPIRTLQALMTNALDELSSLLVP